MSILVVEKDPVLLDLLIFMLRRAGYEALIARDGAAGLRLWQEKQPELVLLETALPNLSGWEVCEAIRKLDQTPLIFLSHATSDVEIVRGLLLGADDYVTKPFSPGQLLARIQAVLRRAQSRGTAPYRSRSVVQSGDLTLDPQWRLARRGDTAIRLTGTEFKLLYELVLHEGQVLSNQSLTERVWGYEGVDDGGVVKGHIRNLRRKLEPDPDGKPIYIQTVPGVGYTYCSQPPAKAAHTPLAVLVSG